MGPLVLALLLQPQSSAPVTRTEVSPPAELAGPRDPRELEAFVDRVASEHLERYRIPGATVAVVKDGVVWLAKGYGVSALSSRKPVDAETTLFSVASVSKVFAATAVVMLSERGVVRMDENVNRYLGRFQIPSDPRGPITLAHLLTHTAGFDDHAIGVYSPLEGPPVSLSAYLASHMPQRIHAPGEIIGYSNYGISLAGEVVEEVAKVPYTSFLQENVFSPLAMKHSVYGVPSKEFDLAVGYALRDAGPTPSDPVYLRNILVPAASLNTTGADMARFMLAQLGAGPRILSDASLEEMHRRRYSLHPDVAGVTYGFHEHFQNRHRAVMHDGDWEGFVSRLFLIPEEKLGLFFVFNASSRPARDSLLEAFLDHYYPTADVARPGPGVEAARGVERFEATYSWCRFPERSVFKVLKLLGRVKVSQTSPGVLRLSSGGRFLPDLFEFPDMTFAPAGALLFERREGEGRLAFRENDRGEITHLQVEVPEVKTTGSMVFERVPWYGVARFQMLLGLPVAALLLSALAWPALSLVRLVRGRLPDAPPESGRARLAAAAAAAIALAFPLAFFLSVQTVAVFAPHYPALAAALTMPLLALGLLPALVWFAAGAWKRRLWSVAARVHYTLVTLAVAGYLLILAYWNMIGFRY